MSIVVSPLTQERLNAQAQVGRDIAKYREAVQGAEYGLVTAAGVFVHRERLATSIRFLVDKAQEEGAEKLRELVDVIQDPEIRQRAKLARLMYIAEQLGGDAGITEANDDAS